MPDPVTPASEKKDGPDQLSFLTNTPPIEGTIKASPSDFIVSEVSNYPKEDPDGDYVIVEVEMTNWETNRAIGFISRALGISRARVGFCGTKDKRAVSTRIFSIKGADVDMSRLQIRDMCIKKWYRARAGLKMGDLQGNRFVIRITGVRPDDMPRAEQTAQCIKDAGGFPNYFGPQRFGSVRPVTHIVGKHILAGDFEGAVRAYIAEPCPGETEEARRARELASDMSRLKEALEIYPPGYSYEQSIMHHLVDRPGDYAGALAQLPKNLALMFVHAYQAHLFNRIVSLRMQDGLPLDRPVMGDRVIPADADGLPVQSEGFLVDELNIEKVRRQVQEGRAFVTGLVIGMDVPFANDAPGEIERRVIMAEFGDLDRARFVVSEIPRLSTKGIRRELLAPVRDLEMEDGGEGTMVMKFWLNKGCYATSLLREFFKMWK
jgi:tRNA pseudouridine13 synthase